MSPVRIDLHCHSDASNKAAEAVLNAISCPECYSDPRDVYAQAKRRGMTFVAITDHDTIDGVVSLAQGRDDVLVGEEVTSWFPEDECKLHLLVYGISSEQHDELQRLAPNIYDVADYIERERIAHSVAHPIYRQNDKLERWHLERLLLLFKGFECLNGAHSPLHREAFEPLLDRLTAAEIARLSETHQLKPRWPEPWIKSRTAGSDDHGLLNIGRTWTEFPGQVSTIHQVLECLRTGMCSPGGEAGSSAKLAHTFYSVAVRYYSRHIMAPDAKPNTTTTLLRTIVGETPAPSKSRIVGKVIKSKLKKISQRIVQPFAKTQTPPDDHTAVLKRLFLQSLNKRVREFPELRDALGKGLPPLGEHERMFDFVSAINRDISQGLSAAISRSIDDASFTGLFDAIAAIIAQQFVLSPYYFSVFHQNKERHLLREITAQHSPKTGQTLKVGLFTDTFDEMNGVGRFLRDMGAQAQELNRDLIIHTCAENLPTQTGGLAKVRKNFQPLLSRPLPYYEELVLNLPPVLEVLEWSDRQQFDVIHVSTPGPMGLCGWLVAKMLRVPLVCTYHTDFPAYAQRLTRDHRVSNGTLAYMKWFYGQAATVLARSKSYRFKIEDMGIADERIVPLPPSVDTTKFNPEHGDASAWSRLGVSQPIRLLYAGRISAEKNLAVLADAFSQICETRNDVALILAGEGPFTEALRQRMGNLPVYFIGKQSDADLAALYASADLFIFPSRTDTLGQAVMEAQACGLPAIVSNEGGPKEVIEDGQTGIVVASDEPVRWANAIQELLNDPDRRKEMGRLAVVRVSGAALSSTFEAFWDAHLNACECTAPSPVRAGSSLKTLTGL